MIKHSAVLAFLLIGFHPLIAESRQQNVAEAAEVQARYRRYLDLKGQLVGSAMSESFWAYADEYHTDVSRQVITGPSSVGKLLKAAQESPLVLVGDVHDNPVDKDHALQILLAMAQGPHPIYVVLEWVPVELQWVVNAYLAGSVSLKQVQSEIQNSGFWPFPLSPYLRLLETMRTVGAKALLPETQVQSKTLQQRDLAILDLVKVTRQRDPQARLLIFYGNYHLLGSGHLATLLQAAGLGHPLIVIGYAEELFWRAALACRARSCGAQKVGDLVEFGENDFFWISGDPLRVLEAQWRLQEAERLQWDADLALLD